MGSRRGIVPVVDGNEYAIVDLAPGDAVVCADPCILVSIHLNTDLSAHALTIKDGATSVYTIKASSGHGTHIDFDSVEFAGGITVAPNASATGTIVVVYYRLN
jgi:hypothetical protein